MVVFGASFIGLMLLPVDFPYWVFALLTLMNGIGSGLFASPNSSSIMSSVPARHRGAASGMRSTFQNSGTALSIGAFFSLMIAGLAGTLPHTLTAGLERHGVAHGIAHQIGNLPPVSSLFASVLGVNPVEHLLAEKGALAPLSAPARHTLTGRQFFPGLISGPFHHGLLIVFAAAAGLAAVAAIASLLRGGRYIHPESAAEQAGTAGQTNPAPQDSPVRQPRPARKSGKAQPPSPVRQDSPDPRASQAQQRSPGKPAQPAGRGQSVTDTQPGEAAQPARRSAE